MELWGVNLLRNQLILKKPMTWRVEYSASDCPSEALPTFSWDGRARAIKLRSLSSGISRKSSEGFSVTSTLKRYDFIYFLLACWLIVPYLQMIGGSNKINRPRNYIGESGLILWKFSAKWEMLEWNLCCLLDSNTKKIWNLTHVLVFCRNAVEEGLYL